MLCSYEVVPVTCTYLLVNLVGYRPTAVCVIYFTFMGGMIRQGPWHEYVLYGAYRSFYWKLRCASNLIFCVRWSIWRYWGKSAPLKRTRWGSWSPRTPCEFFRIYCWTEHMAPKKKLESSLDILFENGCVLHKIQYNGSRITCFDGSLRLPFLLLIF